MRYGYQAIVSLFIFIIGCSGGGSGSDGGSSSSGRTSTTGARIIHAAIDAVPLGLFQNGVYVSKSSYLDTPSFTKLEEIPSTLLITRGLRVNEVVRQISLTPAKDTEYTILVLDQGSDDELDVELLSEPIVRPEKGFGRVSFINALKGQNTATCSLTYAGGSNSLQAAYGIQSNSVDVSAGAVNVSVSGSGGTLHAGAFNLQDRGELVIILGGSKELGFSTIRAIEDLD